MNGELILTPEAEEIRRGLTGSPKSIASKFFYDDEGSRLFQKIMHLPEYYLTRSEHQILREQSAAILEDCVSSGDTIDIIELGPGDGLKSIELLQIAVRGNHLASYLPVDISVHALDLLKARFLARIPALNIELKAGDYLDVLDELNFSHSRKKLILFLGSNIGNFTDKEAGIFLSRLHEDMQSGDRLLIGFDLAKDPATILRAYDDDQGVTAAFNFNLLKRLNREFGASFRLGNFRHVAEYDEQRFEARSYLESKVEQDVRLDALDTRISLAAGERIHTEISRKYSLSGIESMARQNGFEIVRHFFDSREYFCCSLWMKPSSGSDSKQ